VGCAPSGATAGARLNAAKNARQPAGGALGGFGALDDICHHSAPRHADQHALKRR
jgi:hypothetical protein